MSFRVMLRQMTAGFGQTCLIFVMTLIFFAAFRAVGLFWKSQ